MTNKFKNKKGFTLVEMLIAISLFIVVTFFSIGSLLSIFDASKRARDSKTVVDNLNFAIEDMTRVVRFGGSHYCGISSSQTATQDCSGGGSSLSVTFEGNRIIYRWNGSINDPIQRPDNGGAYKNITSPETKIEHLKFYVMGSSDSDTQQSYVFVVIKGYVGNKPTAQSKFSIQTLMSQRNLDTNI